MNAPGAASPRPRRVIEIEEVFEARIASGPQRRVELREELLLDPLVLDDRLDDEVGSGERLELDRAGQSRERGRLLLGRAFAPGNLAVEVFLDGGARFGEQGLENVDEHDRASGCRGHVRDPAAHLAGADDADGTEPHGATL